MWQFSRSCRKAKKLFAVSEQSQKQLEAEKERLQQQVREKCKESKVCLSGTSQPWLRGCAKKAPAQMEMSDHEPKALFPLMEIEQFKVAGAAARSGPARSAASSLGKWGCALSSNCFYLDRQPSGDLLGIVVLSRDKELLIWS